MNIHIKHRYSGATLYEGEHLTMHDALLAAWASGADLRGADLRGADLREADLSGADLRWADLRWADLREADLSGADLRGADLREADLSGADLRWADLREADLSGADLREADLREADLSGADLRGIRDDIYDVLKQSPAEVPTLLAAIREGRINGTVYEGECACLVGTIAKARGCMYTEIPGLVPNGGRPAERWFLALMPGATPENNAIARITAEWIEAWLVEHPQPPWRRAMAGE